MIHSDFLYPLVFLNVETQSRANGLLSSKQTSQKTSCTVAAPNLPFLRCILYANKLVAITQTPTGFFPEMQENVHRWHVPYDTTFERLFTGSAVVH